MSPKSLARARARVRTRAQRRTAAREQRAGAASLPGRSGRGDPPRRRQLAHDPRRATCVDACRYLSGLIVGALQGVAKDELLSPRWSPLPGLWDAEPLTAEIDEVAAGSFKHREPPEIQGGGYVVRSLEAALWAFDRSDDFRNGALLAVNLGDDADTTGAVYGQLAGAYYGADAIPDTWRSLLARRDEIEQLADALFEAQMAAATGGLTDRRRCSPGHPDLLRFHQSSRSWGLRGQAISFPSTVTGLPVHRSRRDALGR